MRKYLIAPAVALTAAGALWVILRIQSSSSETGRSAPLETNAPSRDVRKLEPPFSNQATPVNRWDSSKRPQGLADLRMTPKLAESLHRLGPHSFEVLDYRLGFLERLNRCLAGRINSKGWVDMDFTFEVLDADGGLGMEGIGRDVGLQNNRDLPGGSQLSRGDTDLLVECARQSHLNNRIQFKRRPTQAPFHWMPSFYLPIDDNDLAYRLARTGAWE